MQEFVLKVSMGLATLTSISRTHDNVPAMGGREGETGGRLCKTRDIQWNPSLRKLGHLTNIDTVFCPYSVGLEGFYCTLLSKIYFLLVIVCLDFFKLSCIFGECFRSG